MPRPGASFWIRFALASTIGFALAPTLPAGAESPSSVAAELAIDGVYVAPERTDIDEAPLVEQANQARALALKLVVVAPNDPQPDAEAFARRVLEASDADVALVFPPLGGLEASVIDSLEGDSYRALAAARSKSDPVLATEIFTQELLNEPERSVPAVVSRTIFVVLVLAAVLAAAVILEQAIRRGTAAQGPLWRRPSWWSR